MINNRLENGPYFTREKLLAHFLLNQINNENEFKCNRHIKMDSTGILHLEKCDLNQMVEIDLSHNNITNIEDGSFKGLNNLKQIDLSNNSIKKLSLHLFDDLDNLNHIRLNNNPLEPDYKQFLIQFSNIRNVKVSF